MGGSSFGSVSARPICTMLIDRIVLSSMRSAESKSVRFRTPSKRLKVRWRRPPPRSRQAPVRAGRHAIVRKAMAPFAWCSIPIRVRIAAGLVVA